MNIARLTDFALVGLLLLTAGSYAIASHSGVAWVLGIAALKSVIIAGVFMDLARATKLGWGILASFMALVCLGVVLLF